MNGLAFGAVVLCLSRLWAAGTAQGGIASSMICHCEGEIGDTGNCFCKEGCLKGWSGPGCQISNVAKMKTAQQSSTLVDREGTSYSATNAVDGKPSGRFCSRTLPQINSPYWFVTLSIDTLYVITNVTIFRKLQEAEGTALSSFYLLLSNDTNNDIVSKSTWHECTTVRDLQSYESSYSCGGTRARRVGILMLPLTSPESLYLCEVEVQGFIHFGCSDTMTGPGCLLYKYNTPQCQQLSGARGEFGECRFPVCPGSRHWPPDCWMTMPILVNSTLQTSATCDKLEVTLSGAVEGNLDPEAVVMELVSPLNASVIEKRVDGRKVQGLKFLFQVTAGQAFTVSYRLKACQGGTCHTGPPGSTLTILTEERKLIHSRKNQCLHFAIESSSARCESAAITKIVCQSSETHSYLASRGVPVCNVSNSDEYNCSVTILNGNGVEVISVVYVQLEDTQSAAILGGAVGAVLIIILVSVLLVAYNRRRKNRKRSSEKAHFRLRNGEQEMHNTEEDGELCYENLSDISLKDLECLANDRSSMIQSFQNLPSNELHSALIGKQMENKVKNRFQNIVPYDQNRVILHNSSNNDDGYINASYIQGYTVPKHYIATQGPTHKTVEDFWNMVWYENSFLIVMMTDYQEDSKRKCEPYFPKQPTFECDITVHVHSSSSFDTHVTTLLELTKGGESRLLYHCHFLAWPQHDVPQHFAEFLLFFKTANFLVQHRSSQVGPVIVHCSAGVGRTAAFIALDYMLQRYHVDGLVNVGDCVRRLREQRMLMVQTKEQYIFLHKAMVYAIKTEKYIMEAKLLSAHCKALSQAYENTTHLLKEWQMIQECSEDSGKGSSKAAVEPQRYTTARDLQGNAAEGFLTPVYCKSCYSSTGFLPARLPSLSAIDEFWKTVFVSDASCIVLLHSLPKDPSFPQYWPKPGAEEVYGYYTVSNVGAESSNQLFEAMELHVQGPSSKDFKVVKLFIFRMWKDSQEIPTDMKKFLKFAHFLRSYCTDQSNRPVVVQCKDGASHCGLFITAINALYRLLETNMVQVFHTVEIACISHPQFVKTPAQYGFIYKLLQLHCDSPSSYTTC